MSVTVWHLFAFSELVDGEERPSGVEGHVRPCLVYNAVIPIEPDLTALVRLHFAEFEAPHVLLEEALSFRAESASELVLQSQH